MWRPSEKPNAQAVPVFGNLNPSQLRESLRPLDYSQLPPKGLGPRQIRLIEILPGSDGSPIHCTLTVVDLPAEVPRTDILPPNYIHCDHWVPEKPEEAFGAQLHRDVSALQDEMMVKERKSAKFNRAVNNLLHKYLDKPPIKRDDVFIPVFDMLKMVDREDIVAVLGDEEINEGFKMNLGMLDDDNNLKSNWDGPVAQVSLDSFPMFYRKYVEDPDESLPANAPSNYLAMSYEWGDPNGPKKYIFINGHRHQVRENLHAGLSQFRKMEYFRKGSKIWIDAICFTLAAARSVVNSAKETSFCPHVCDKIADLGALLLKYSSSWSDLQLIKRMVCSGTEM
ncbi:hypothetical protein IQ07DRAFT_585922 [Pyrenochaeta sp. DS3sAY3a]|nr:hypothetical protein IQ07DRAFT_585922 [Pyrenochaeta sp. DS3sAY3a]